MPGPPCLARHLTNRAVAQDQPLRPAARVRPARDGRRQAVSKRFPASDGARRSRSDQPSRGRQPALSLGLVPTRPQTTPGSPLPSCRAAAATAAVSTAATATEARRTCPASPPSGGQPSRFGDALDPVQGPVLPLATAVPE